MRELSTPLTEEDKAWLRSWNRGHEIPEDEPTATTEPEKPADPPKDPPPVDPPVTVDGSTTNPATDAGDGGTAEDPFNGEEPPADYNDWTIKQLEHELSVGRKLPKTGNKAELVARLVSDDEANPE